MKSPIKFSLAASAIVGLTMGAVGAAFAGLPVIGVLAVASAAAAGAAAASGVAYGLMSGFNGRGPSAGFMGLGLWAISHVTLVPGAAAVAGLYVGSQFKAAAAADAAKKEPGRTILGATLKEEFKGACDGATIKNGGYVLPKGCSVAPR